MQKSASSNNTHRNIVLQVCTVYFFMPLTDVAFQKPVVCLFNILFYYNCINYPCEKCEASDINLTCTLLKAKGMPLSPVQTKISFHIFAI